MIRRPPRSTPLYSSAASDVYKRQEQGRNNLAASGQAVLPKTGESENPLYSLIGVSLLGVVIYLINKMKREKELI